MILNVINIDPSQPCDKYANPELKKQIIRNREERILSIVQQSKQHGFAVRFWEGDLTDEVFPCKNISRSFKKIVQYAKEERLPMITIGEDDLHFTSPNSWKYYIENIPEDFDLYLGGIYAGELHGNRIVNGYSGHTLLTVHERAYDFFLSADEDPLGFAMGHIDRWCGKFCKEKKFIVALPFVIKQMGGYSENKKRVQDYSIYEEAWTYLT